MNVALLVSGIFCSALAQVLLKLSSKAAGWSLPWIGALGGAALSYGVSFFLYSLILRKSELSRIGPLMTSATALLVAAAGVILFGEDLTLRRGIGIGLGVAALVFLAG
jgi:multidrug transporter EmrE-like cation transporter